MMSTNNILHPAKRASRSSCRGRTSCSASITSRSCAKACPARARSWRDGRNSSMPCIRRHPPPHQDQVPVEGIDETGKVSKRWIETTAGRVMLGQCCRFGEDFVRHHQKADDKPKSPRHRPSLPVTAVRRRRDLLRPASWRSSSNKRVQGLASSFGKARHGGAALQGGRSSTSTVTLAKEIRATVQ